MEPGPPPLKKLVADMVGKDPITALVMTLKECSCKCADNWRAIEERLRKSILGRNNSDYLLSISYAEESPRCKRMAVQ